MYSILLMEHVGKGVLYSYSQAYWKLLIFHLFPSVWTLHLQTPLLYTNSAVYYSSSLWDRELLLSVTLGFFLFFFSETNHCRVRCKHHLVLLALDKLKTLPYKKINAEKKVGCSWFSGAINCQAGNSPLLKWLGSWVEMIEQQTWKTLLSVCMNIVQSNNQN